MAKKKKLKRSSLEGNKIVKSYALNMIKRTPQELQYSLTISTKVVIKLKS